MMHDRVTHEHRLINLILVNPCFRTQGLNQIIQGRSDGIGHFDVTAGVHHGVTNAAHQIFTEPNLRVHNPARGRDFACAQISQMGRNRGRPQINRQPE